MVRVDKYGGVISEKMNYHVHGNGSRFVQESIVAFSMPQSLSSERGVCCRRALIYVLQYHLDAVGYCVLMTARYCSLFPEQMTGGSRSSPYPEDQAGLVGDVTIDVAQVNHPSMPGSKDHAGSLKQTLTGR